MKRIFLPKEISWLYFNERVLQEAEGTHTPLLERIRFLGIYSNNLDEFYRVRVANLQRLLKSDGNAREMGMPVREILKTIRCIVLDQSRKFSAVFQGILAAMEKEGVRLVNESQLSANQKFAALEYFQNQVRPRLVPIMLDQKEAKPRMRDPFLYLAILISGRGAEAAKKKHALIEVPTDTLSRFFILPGPGDRRDIMLLEDVIRLGLPQIFSTLRPGKIEAWTVKVTQDSELAMDDDLSESYVARISDSLKKRATASPVRLVYEGDMPESLLRAIRKVTGITRQDFLLPGSRYHNFKDFIKFPNPGKSGLIYPKLAPIPHPAFTNGRSFFDVIAKRDVLLHFPYHSFNIIPDFLREAAIDPKVTKIRITIYRVASQNSSILNALINAARNGKQVTVLLEILARFDEENNILWAERLRSEGVHVIVGVRGLKVHGKLCIVSRKEHGKVRHYATIGTGNFNEDTAKIYTDHILMTSAPEITQEVLYVFNFFKNNFKVPRFRELIVSPFNSRDAFLEKIKREISNAKKGRRASICLKLNNLADEELISALYKASRAGVKIRLIVRGMMSLLAGVPGLSENIEAISIVGRYLEHSRFLILENDGDPEVYISSSDWMGRNLDERVEVSVPVKDARLRKELISYFETEWGDHCKARLVSPERMNQFRGSGTRQVPSQMSIYRYLKQSKLN